MRSETNKLENNKIKIKILKCGLFRLNIWHEWSKKKGTIKQYSRIIII